MDKNAKTDNFLKAIHKYAEKQQNEMRNEVSQIKDKRLKLAKEKGKHDSDAFVQKQLAEKRNYETSIIAKQTQEGQKKLFLKRAEMAEDIFNKAEKKLIDYTKTEEYKKLLSQSAKAIADVIKNEDCILYLNERDMNYAELLGSVFGGKTEFVADNTVKIGGVKAYCKKMSIVADETLDSKLNAQKEWFIENSGLSVL